MNLILSKASLPFLETYLQAKCPKKILLKNRHAGVSPHDGKRRVVMKSFYAFQSIF